MIKLLLMTRVELDTNSDDIKIKIKSAEYQVLHQNPQRFTVSVYDIGLRYHTNLSFGEVCVWKQGDTWVPGHTTNNYDIV